MSRESCEQARRQAVYLWRRLRLAERSRLSAAYRGFLDAFGRDAEKAASELWPALLEKLTTAEKRSLFYPASKIQCRFPEELPITAKIPEIRAALRSHQVVLVCGATGSGKTTQLPKAALAEGFGRTGRIGCTQPRRLAATALAGRFAAETGVETGREVGYKVRFDDHTGDATVVKFMTDGILLAETRSDPLLLQYDCIILDEVHERSLNIDFLLGYLRKLLEKRRDLRVVISSATLESDRISAFFSGAPVIEVEGRLFPVEDLWLEPEEDEELSESVARAAETLAGFDPAGDILVFLPGEREIRDAAEMLEGRRWPNTEILPLFGRLSAGEQNKIFQRSARRRIVLATNVAETSLTIPGIRFVIDSGLVRLSRYNPKNRIQELRVEFVSKASARQRRGRCGRLRDGVCAHLYPEEKLAEADDYTAPEIQRSSLAGVILQMASLRLPPIDVFPFVDPPGPALIREGLSTLSDLGAIDGRQHLTQTGWELAALPLDPQLGKMLLEAKKHRVLPELLVIAAFLSIPDPRERPFEHAKDADAAQRKFDAKGSDFLSALVLWRAVSDALKNSTSALRRFTKTNYLNFRRVREWRSLADDLAELAAPELAGKEIFPADRSVNEDAVHQVLMSALPRHLAMFDPENKCYLDRAGKRFQIFPGSVLARGKGAARWILSFALVETSRVYARCNAEVQGIWLEQAAPQLCSKAYDSVRWDAPSGFVVAREKIMAGQLVIHPGRRCHYGRIDPVKAREVFIREALAPGALHLPDVAWVNHFEEQCAALRSLEIKRRRPESLLDENAASVHFDSVLPPEICSADAVRKDWQAHRRDHAPDRRALLFDPEEELNEADYPDFLIQSGQRFHLDYEFDPGERGDGLTLTVPEADLPLIDPNTPAWLVPGYLPWKLELMLKSLPKVTRREIMPLGECVDCFMAELRGGRIFTDQNFASALCDFLAEQYGIVLVPADFRDFETPDFLNMKIAVADARGKILRVLDELPDAGKAGSRLARSHRAAKELGASGCRDWPEGISLPESVAVSPDGKKLAFPALCDEGETIGVSLFLNEADALASHVAGLRRLARLKLPRQIGYLTSMMKFPHRMELSFFLNDSGWKTSLADFAIDAAWGVPPSAVRSPEIFENALENLRGNVAGKLADAIGKLEDIYTEYDRMENARERLDGDSETAADADAQLEFLFRPGFLRATEAVGEYKRYLRSLGVRLDRAAQGPSRDVAKGEWLEPFVRKFQLAAANLDKPVEQLPGLYDFFLLLEEARIAAYTPELRTKRKATPEILADAWRELRW